MDEENERLQIHIAGLEATLTKRNQEIERLREALKAAEVGEVSGAKLRREYKKGFEDCASHLMNSTQRLANELGKVRQDAWRLYLQAERDARQEATEGAE